MNLLSPYAFLAMAPPVQPGQPQPPMWVNLVPLAVLAILVSITLVTTVFYCLSLQKALNRCSPQCRAMNPGMV